RAAEAGFTVGAPTAADLARLDETELDLVRFAAQWPRIVEAAANAHEPHRIAFYLGDLAAAFHANWNRGNDDPSKRYLIADDPGITNARLALARGLGQVIANGLHVMGVTPVEEMH
ncbi:MAG: arginine--tRNA ligase, partial [Sphingosinicella sp.]|nr:arginine--tRNA ligase [Sphingosinicella sp.]